MNNLYDWAMSEYLPYDGFNWLKNVDKFDVMSISEKGLIGYLSEVDLKYSNKLHEYTMIIHYLQKNLLFQMICGRNIVKELLINMR